LYREIVYFCDLILGKKPTFLIACSSTEHLTDLPFQGYSQVKCYSSWMELRLLIYLGPLINVPKLLYYQSYIHYGQLSAYVSWREVWRCLIDSQVKCYSSWMELRLLIYLGPDRTQSRGDKKCRFLSKSGTLMMPDWIAVF
jgi:hypothetical protein